MPFLSFCIPTRQRKEFLLETLSSILSQITEDVEIVISDNASTDGTQEALEKIQKTAPSIVYHRFATEIPCGENLLHSVHLASGDFCWLMTDDDRVEKDALMQVLTFLKEHPGISGLSVNVQGYTWDMAIKKNIFYSHSLKKDTLFVSSDNWYANLGAWCGFWSAQIVSRQKWQQALYDTRYKAFEGYPHLFLLAAIVYSAPYWGYIHQRLVGYRSDNESFSKEYGRFKRMYIDFYTYDRLGAMFFSKQAIYKVKKQVLCSLLFWQLVRAKIEGLSCQDHFRLFFHSLYTYYKLPLYWILFLPLLMAPKIFLKALRPLFKRIRKFV
jgi:glycosyltransferase involved in cell wall biosynthesis